MHKFSSISFEIIELILKFTFWILTVAMKNFHDEVIFYKHSIKKLVSRWVIFIYSSTMCGIMNKDF